MQFLGKKEIVAWRKKSIKSIGFQKPICWSLFMAIFNHSPSEKLVKFSKSIQLLYIGCLHSGSNDQMLFQSTFQCMEFEKHVLNITISHFKLLVPFPDGNSQSIWSKEKTFLSFLSGGMRLFLTAGFEANIGTIFRFIIFRISYGSFVNSQMWRLWWQQSRLL